MPMRCRRFCVARWISGVQEVAWYEGQSPGLVRFPYWRGKGGGDGVLHLACAEALVAWLRYLRKGIAVLGVDGLDGKRRMRIGLRVLPGDKVRSICID